MTAEQIKRISEKGFDSAKKKFITGIRPEDITISKEKIDDAHALGEVYVTSPVGKDKIIEIEGHRMNVITSVDYDIEMGETAWIQFNKKKMHGFDIATTGSLF